MFPPVLSIPCVCLLSCRKPKLSCHLQCCKCSPLHPHRRSKDPLVFKTVSTSGSSRKELQAWALSSLQRPTLGTLSTKQWMWEYSLHNGPYKCSFLSPPPPRSHATDVNVSRKKKRERRLDHWTWHPDATQQSLLPGENKSWNYKLWTVGTTTNQRIPCKAATSENMKKKQVETTDSCSVKRM